MTTRSSQCPVYILGLHNQARGRFPTTATLHRATLLGSHHEYAGRVTLPPPLGPARYMVQATNSSPHRRSDSTLRAYTLITVLILLPALLAAPFAASAQQAAKVPRIGFLSVVGSAAPH